MLVVLTSATGEAVAVEEVKEHLRVESTQDDVLLGGYITVARKILENKIRRAILPTQYKLVLSAFPSATDTIELPNAPLLSSTCSTVQGSTSVSVLFYRDTTVVNDSTYVPSTVYALDTASVPGRIYPIYDNEWPSCVTDYKKDAVQISYWSGYESVSKVPEPLKQWIKMKVASLYENREPLYEGRFGNSVEALPHEYYDGLLDPYIVINVR